ncbi:melatonin receptor type 1A-like [Ptychodera flava]|uniref:melatonin receptor type 1A-like n=1 Tax=Ptychodera flava TaxID=63121 RepID=UPI00396A9986
MPTHSKYSPMLFRCRAYIGELDSALTLYIPSLVTVIFYVLIFFAVRKSRRRVQAYPGHIGDTHAGPNAQEVRMLKILLVVFFMITFGYLPYIIIANTYMWLRIPQPDEVYIIMYPGLHIAGCLNPILYGGCNKNFRVACIELLTGKLFRGNVTSFEESERPAVQTTSMTVREGNMGVTATVSFVDERAGHTQTTASLTASAHEGSTAEAIIPRTAASL